MPAKIKINTGDRFGRLTIIKESEPKIDSDGSGIRMFLCKCDCGKNINTRLASLRFGLTQSCGCLYKETRGINPHRKHSYSNTAPYRVLKGILDRCYNEKSMAYKNYGGRGISVCEEWRNNYAAFCEWAIRNGYKKGLQIDRIDNDGNYEPSNCRWANSLTQCKNRRGNIIVSLNGENLILKDACKKLGIENKYKIVHQRMKRGNQSFERAITF
jgi:hypothetical protein